MKLKENKFLKNLFLVLTICVLSGLGLTAMGQETRTALVESSNASWSPAVSSSVSWQITKIECWGGGGAGSASRTGGNGGGGGGYAAANVTDIPVNTPVSIVIGQGGAGTVSGARSAAPGGDGGNTTVSYGGVVYVGAYGGKSGGNGRTGGQGGWSDKGLSLTTHNGGNGGTGYEGITYVSTYAGSGGGGAGSQGNGFNGDNATWTGNGAAHLNGTNEYGGGAYGGACHDNGAGGGQKYGGGGGGSCFQHHSSYDEYGGSGSGAQGLVRITYTVFTESANVTFNANMPQNDNNMNSAIPANANIARGDLFDPILVWRDASYQTARRGYTFSGWNTAADGTGTTIAAGMTSNYNTDITLYAQWTPFTMTVTFDVNGGTWATQPNPNPFQVTYGETYSSKTGWDWQVPTKTGYLFQGWKLDGGSTYFGPDSKVNQIANHKLVAEWVAEENLPSAKTVCYEDVVSLCAPSGYSGYTWTPAAGLSDATSQCPTLTAANMTSASVQYKCNYTSGSVFNGDFNLGNQGFSSDYDFVTDASDVNNELQPERKISTTTCWHNVHNSLDTACTLKSYENDGGMFLAVNGGKFPNEVVWEQTVTVAKNTKYRISVQCAAASPDGDAAPAKLMFFVNGAKVSTDTTKVASHAWQEMFVEWQNTDAVFATIAIKDFTEATGGNDFAIDHVVVEAIDGLGKEYTVDVTRRDQFNPGAIATTGQTRNYGTGTNNAIGSTTAATGGDNTISYQWYQNGTEISGATGATYTPTVTEPGTYVFTRKAKDGTCVELTASTGSWTLTINNVTVSIDTVKGAKAFCAGGSTTLTAEATASQGTISYKWSNGATTASTTVSAAGDYTVTASVTVNDITRTDSKTVTVTVNPLPSFTVSTTPESCKGHDGKAEVSDVFVAYEWSNGDDTQAPDTLTSLVNGGNYSVTVTDANGCQASKNNVNITLNNTLAVSDITGPVVCTGTEFTIFPEDAPEGTTYSWPAPAAISGISGLEAGEGELTIHGVLEADRDVIVTPTEVEYTVTPKNGVCTGNAMGVTVTVTTTVNPGVIITMPTSMDKCAGAEVEIPAKFENCFTPHTVKWVLKGTTDTITHANLAVNKDTLRVTLPETCSAEYSYLVFDADNSGCVASDGCVITVNSGNWTLPENIVELVGCPADADVTPTAAQLPSVTDGCGKPVTPSLSANTRYLVRNTSGGLYLSKTVYKYKYKSCDGNSKTFSYTKSVNYLDPRVTCEDNQSVSTDNGKNFATMSFENPVVWDSCVTPSIKITYDPTTPVNATADNASGQYPIGKTTVTYTVTNNAGKTATCSFDVTVADNEAPVIVAPADIVVDKYTAVPDPFTTLDEFLAAGGTVSDNVAYNPDSFAYLNESDGQKCPETFTRKYFISDYDRNTAFAVQKVIVKDSIAPTFTAPADDAICRVAPAGTINASTTITGEPTNLADNNSAVADLRYEFSDLDTTIADDKGMCVIHRQWKLIDECENATTKVQNISIYPVITAENTDFKCPDDLHIILDFGACDTLPNIGTATYDSDFYGHTLRLTNNAPTGRYQPGTTTYITWTLTDVDCNFSVSCIQTITVNFPDCPVAIDADGNEYNSVRIGCDCWTQTNLKSNNYSDGVAIPGVYSYVSDMYPDVNDNVAKFGRLYDWESVIKDGADNAYGHLQGICPDGWYLPTDLKYDFLGTFGVDALKSPLYWLDGGGNNSTGFTSLPGGYYDGSINRYLNLMGEAYYWATTKVDDHWTPVPCNIHYTCNAIIDASSREGLGYSVRCIKEKDAETAPEPAFECGVSTIEDVDGNTYNTVKIGDQCWTKENLRTSTINGYGNVYTNPLADVETYGRLYDWAAAMQGATSSEATPSGVQGICPTGWHVPSYAEWTALKSFVIYQIDYTCGGNPNNNAKALASNTGWSSSTVACEVGNDLTLNNKTGFSAMPAGWYYDSYINLFYDAYIWSATQNDDNGFALGLQLSSSSATLYGFGTSKSVGCSVRCLKDGEPVTPGEPETPEEPEFSCGTSTVKDHQGNEYNTVLYGGQCWMKENMRCTTTPSNPEVSILNGTSTENDPRAYAPGSNDVTKFGMLYTWPAAMDSTFTAIQDGTEKSFANRRGICPEGWHLPTDAEWNTMFSYVQTNYACDAWGQPKIAKPLAATEGWNVQYGGECLPGKSQEDNNASDFTAFPTGMNYYHDAYTDTYQQAGDKTAFWSATQANGTNAYFRSIETWGADVNRVSENKKVACSVRCVKDEQVNRNI